MSSVMSLPPLREFDAFPKTSSTYKVRSKQGGIATLFVIVTCILLVFNEIGDWLYGQNVFTFGVDTIKSTEMQMNVDMTVAMPCHYLSVDVRDAVGDRLKLGQQLRKDGTVFDTSNHNRVDQRRISKKQSRLSKIMKDSRKGSSWFGKTKTKDRFKKTKKVIKNGPACRIYGSVETKKMNGNLHVTTLGHGYASAEHTDHKLMNLSHIIDEFSFGDHFPYISQPLDKSVEVNDNHFPIYQYFLHVVPTTYVDSYGRTLETNQYSAREDIKLVQDHRRGIPGLFFRYDIEPIHLSTSQRTMPLKKLLVRLAALIGGIWSCSGFGLRVLDKFAPKKFKPHPSKVGQLQIPITSPNVNQPSPNLLSQTLSPNLLNHSPWGSPPPPYYSNQGLLSPEPNFNYLKS